MTNIIINKLNGWKAWAMTSGFQIFMTHFLCIYLYYYKRKKMFDIK